MTNNTVTNFFQNDSNAYNPPLEHIGIQIFCLDQHDDKNFSLTY